MVNPPTDGEMICMAILGIISLIGIIYSFVAGKRGTGYIKWIRDWKG